MVLVGVRKSLGGGALRSLETGLQPELIQCDAPTGNTISFDGGGNWGAGGLGDWFAITRWFVANK